MPPFYDSSALYLLARSLAFPSCAGTSARLMAPTGADTILYALLRIRRRVPDLLVDEGTGVSLFFPLFAKKGVWAFSSVYNQPCLLRAFWRAVLELLFGVSIDKDVPGTPCLHSLIFSSGIHEFEVTDEWGSEWYIVIRALGVGEESRSRSSTPDRADGWEGE